MELVAYFFERTDAEEVRRRLASTGIDAVVRRERFHGEDDDEDHPWTVVTADPAAAGLLKELAAAHDGWLDTAEPVRPVTEAPVLPAAPKRFKNA